MSVIATAGDPAACASCGLQVPTKLVEFQQNIGMIVTRRKARIAGPLCRRCASAYFKSYTLTTVFLGWWGVVSFIVTPVFIVSNVIQFLKARSLPAPQAIIANVPYDSSSAPIRVGTPSLKFKLLYGALIWAAVFIFAAEQSVDLVQKYAPSLNGRLHGGEITDEADAQYAGMKIWGDIAALNAPTMSKDWAGLRVELLARQTPLDDLIAKNTKVQAAVASERTTGSASNDPCEQLALNQLAPAINDYTNAWEQFFSLLRSTATLTEQTRTQIDAITDRQQAASDRMSKYFSESKAEGCSK